MITPWPSDVRHPSTDGRHRMLVKHPPVPARPGAPEAPTWAECDAVVRRAYTIDTQLGDVLAGERLTGLRVEQVVGIRRRAIDPIRMTLVVPGPARRLDFVGPLGWVSRVRQPPRSTA